MPAPQDVLRVGKCDVLLLGTVPGYVPDGDRVRVAIENHQPEVVALGVPDIDLEALEKLIADPTLADGLEPDGLDLYFLTLVAEWGPTQLLPSPDLHSAHASGVPLRSVDMDDETHTQLFADTVKLRHLVQRSSVRKRLGKTPIEDANDPYHLAGLFDEGICSIAPLGKLEAAREETMADGIRSLAAEHDRLVAIVHCARYTGVLTRLSHPS